MKHKRQIDEQDIERLLKQSFMEGTGEFDDSILESASEVVFGMEVEEAVPDHFEKQLLSKNKNFTWWKLVVLVTGVLGFIGWFVLPTNDEMPGEIELYSQNEKNSSIVIDPRDSSKSKNILNTVENPTVTRGKTKDIMVDDTKQDSQLLSVKKIRQEKQGVSDSSEIVKLVNPIVTEKERDDDNTISSNNNFTTAFSRVNTKDINKQKEKAKINAPDFSRQKQQKIDEVIPPERNNQDLSDFEGTYFTEDGYIAKLSYKGSELKLKVKGKSLKIIKTITPDGKTVAMEKQGTATWFITFLWDNMANIVGFTASEDNQNFITYKKLMD